MSHGEYRFVSMFISSSEAAGEVSFIKLMNISYEVHASIIVLVSGADLI